MTPHRRDDREQVRGAVGARYAGLALAAQVGHQVTGGGPAGCAAGGLGPAAYPDAGGVPEGAVRASLGCGNPVAVADLRPGETVLDLGSGGGIDVLLSARRVGPAGKAYGLDMTGEMLDLARAHAEQAGAGNAEFLLGQIEAIPLSAGSVDVIISNCVINLSADRTAVFAESFRVLRPGGRLGVSDILAEDHLTAAQRIERGAPAGCIAGAPSFTEYRDGLTRAGFTAITITRTTRSPTACIRRSSARPGPEAMPASGAGVPIEAMIDAHAAAVLAIYQAGIDEGNATFETRAPGWEEFTGARLGCHRYVAVTGTGVLGWVAASWAPGNGSPSTTAAGATPCSSSAAARSCKPGGRQPGGQEVAARRGARRSTRRLSSDRAASKLAGSPAGTGSGTDQCTAAASPSSSRAMSQTVTTRSPSCRTSLRWRGRSRGRGRWWRRAAAIAPGSIRAAGWVPADTAGTVLARRHSAAARCERAELAVHTNRTRRAARPGGTASESSVAGTSCR